MVTTVEKRVRKDLNTDYLLRHHFGGGKMNVLIFGGTGFVGRNLIEELLKVSFFRFNR